MAVQYVIGKDARTCTTSFINKRLDRALFRNGNMIQTNQASRTSLQFFPTISPAVPTTRRQSLWLFSVVILLTFFLSDKSFGQKTSGTRSIGTLEKRLKELIADTNSPVASIQSAFESMALTLISNRAFHAADSVLQTGVDVITERRAKAELIAGLLAQHAAVLDSLNRPDNAEMRLLEAMELTEQIRDPFSTARKRLTIALARHYILYGEYNQALIVLESRGENTAETYLQFLNEYASNRTASTDPSGSPTKADNERRQRSQITDSPVLADNQLAEYSYVEAQRLHLLSLVHRELQLPEKAYATLKLAAASFSRSGTHAGNETHLGILQALLDSAYSRQDIEDLRASVKYIRDLQRHPALKLPRQLVHSSQFIEGFVLFVEGSYLRSAEVLDDYLMGTRTASRTNRAQCSAALNLLIRSHHILGNYEAAVGYLRVRVDSTRRWHGNASTQATEEVSMLIRQATATGQFGIAEHYALTQLGFTEHSTKDSGLSRIRLMADLCEYWFKAQQPIRADSILDASMRHIREHGISNATVLFNINYANARMRRFQLRYDESYEAIKQCLTLFDKCDSTVFQDWRAVDVFLLAGAIYQHRRQYDTSAMMYRYSLSHLDKQYPRKNKNLLLHSIDILRSLITCQRQSGDLVNAAADSERLIALRDSLDDGSGNMSLFKSTRMADRLDLAALRIALGQTKSARAILNDVDDIATQSRARSAKPQIMAKQALCDFAEGSVDSAAVRVRTALALFEAGSLADADSYINALCLFSEILLLKADNNKADSILKIAEHTYGTRIVNSPLTAMRIDILRADCSLTRNACDEALPRYDKAFESPTRPIGQDAYLLGRMLFGKAICLRSRDKPGAIKLLHEALNFGIMPIGPLGRHLIEFELGNLHMSIGDFSTARRHFDSSLRLMLTKYTRTDSRLRPVLEALLTIARHQRDEISEKALSRSITQLKPN